MSFSIQKWLEENTKGDVVHFFEGVISTKIVIGALDEIEKKLEEASVVFRLRKRIYNLLIESLQNLCHHSKEMSRDGDEGKFAVCLLRKTSNGYTIINGNFVTKDQREFLTKHLDYISTLDENELKGFYKDILNTQGFSEKGGGGLGLVDIARKSRNNIDYEFFEYDSDTYFFSLQIDVKE